MFRREFFGKALAWIAAALAFPSVALPKPQARYQRPGDLFIPDRMRNYLIRFAPQEWIELDAKGRTVLGYGLVAHFGPETSFDAAKALIADKWPGIRPGFLRESIDVEFAKTISPRKTPLDERYPVMQMRCKIIDVEIVSDMVIR